MIIKALYFCAWVTIAHLVVFLLGTVLPEPTDNIKLLISFLGIGWSISAIGVWILEEATATELGMPSPPKDVYERPEEEWKRLGSQARWIMSLGAPMTLIAFTCGQKMVRQEALHLELTLGMLTFTLQALLLHWDDQELHERAQKQKAEESTNKNFPVPFYS